MCACINSELPARKETLASNCVAPLSMKIETQVVFSRGTSVEDKKREALASLLTITVPSVNAESPVSNAMWTFLLLTFLLRRCWLQPPPPHQNKQPPSHTVIIFILMLACAFFRSLPNHNNTQGLPSLSIHPYLFSPPMWRYMLKCVRKT